MNRHLRLVELARDRGCEWLPALDEASVLRFENDHRVVLPEEYRDFLLNVGRGGPAGPEYGLLPLGAVPSHWSAVHDYPARLSREHPLTDEWVWEDEPDRTTVPDRLRELGDGLLLLGEEGCGARWYLVVTGTDRGEVWLLTGEGATPCRPRMQFQAWLETLLEGGIDWWDKLVAPWGPTPGAWFASHALKKMLVNQMKETGEPPERIEQSHPLCLDCREFLSKATRRHSSRLTVVTPGVTWEFDEGETRES